MTRFKVRSAYGPSPTFSWDCSTAKGALAQAEHEARAWKEVWVYDNGTQISVVQLRELARKEAQPR